MIQTLNFILMKSKTNQTCAFKRGSKSSKNITTVLTNKLLCQNTNLR